MSVIILLIDESFNLVSYEPHYVKYFTEVIEKVPNKQSVYVIHCGTPQVEINSDLKRQWSDTTNNSPNIFLGIDALKNLLDDDKKVPENSVVYLYSLLRNTPIGENLEHSVRPFKNYIKMLEIHFILLYFSDSYWSKIQNIKQLIDELNVESFFFELICSKFKFDDLQCVDVNDFARYSIRKIFNIYTVRNIMTYDRRLSILSQYAYKLWSPMGIRQFLNILIEILDVIYLNESPPVIVNLLKCRRRVIGLSRVMLCNEAVLDSCNLHDKLYKLDIISTRLKCPQLFNRFGSTVENAYRCIELFGISIVIIRRHNNADGTINLQIKIPKDYSIIRFSKQYKLLSNCSSEKTYVSLKNGTKYNAIVPLFYLDLNEKTYNSEFVKYLIACVAMPSTWILDNDSHIRVRNACVELYSKTLTECLLMKNTDDDLINAFRRTILLMELIPIGKLTNVIHQFTESFVLKTPIDDVLLSRVVVNICREKYNRNQLKDALDLNIREPYIYDVMDLIVERTNVFTQSQYENLIKQIFANYKIIERGPIKFTECGKIWKIVKKCKKIKPEFSPDVNLIVKELFISHKCREINCNDEYLVSKLFEKEYRIANKFNYVKKNMDAYRSFMSCVHDDDDSVQLLPTEIICCPYPNCPLYNIPFSRNVTFEDHLFIGIPKKCNI